MKASNVKKAIAFDFVLEELYSVDPFVRPMFGCHAVYVNGAIVLILRKRDSHQQDNGVWIATIHEHHDSLKKDFGSLRSIKLLGAAESAWQNLPASDENFEEDVLKVCKLILKGDPRIGKIPKRKK